MYSYISHIYIYRLQTIGVPRVSFLSVATGVCINGHGSLTFGSYTRGRTFHLLFSFSYVWHVWRQVCVCVCAPVDGQSVLQKI